MKFITILSWLLRIVAAVILLQTLFFKFTAHPESVTLFSKLNVEPWGRIGTGFVELFVSILILVPATVFMGSFLGIGVMMGAIASHIFVLGIESAGDGGQLFFYANIVLVCCIVVSVIHKKQGIVLINKLRKS